MNKKNLIYILKIALALLFFIPCTVISECWNVPEISSLAFKELDGSMVFSFKDAVSCAPVSGASVKINNRTFATDSMGYINIPNTFFETVMEGTLSMTAEKSDYCTLKQNIKVMVGTVKDKRFLMSKRLPIGKARFSLKWGNKPRDLDLHLVGKDFHISYRNMKIAGQKAKLDRDDVDGYGPETITLNKIISANTYDVYVHNYSGKSSINDQAQVYVFKDNQMDRLITLPQTSKRYVKILEIKDRFIQYVNIPVDRIP